MKDLAHQLVDAIDPDQQFVAAQQATGTIDPDAEALAKAETRDVREGAAADRIEPDVLRRARRTCSAASSRSSTRSARTRSPAPTSSSTPSPGPWRPSTRSASSSTTTRTRSPHCRCYYSKPYAHRPTYSDIRELADAIGKPPHRWTADKLWDAYETLDESKVRGSAGTVLTNLVSLVRFTLGLDDELAPFPEQVAERFEGWILQQQQAGRTFTPSSVTWLELIRDHVAAQPVDRTRRAAGPTVLQHGGLFKARELFGQDLDGLLDELT